MAEMKTGSNILSLAEWDIDIEAINAIGPVKQVSMKGGKAWGFSVVIGEAVVEVAVTNREQYIDSSEFLIEQAQRERSSLVNAWKQIKERG